MTCGVQATASSTSFDIFLTIGDKNPGPCFTTYVLIPVFRTTCQHPAIRAFRRACVRVDHLLVFVVFLQQ